MVLRRVVQPAGMDGGVRAGGREGGREGKGRSEREGYGKLCRKEGKERCSWERLWGGGVSISFFFFLDLGLSCFFHNFIVILEHKEGV